MGPERDWRRIWLPAAALFLSTAAFVVWQNTRVAVLWDLGYLLDTSWRIALGQTPYRDFPLVHAPLTFLIQAAIMRVAGRHYELHVAYAAVAGGLATVVGWRILYRVLKGRVKAAWTVSLLLTAPLVVLGIYGVYPHPIYDCDCALAILMAVLLLGALAMPAGSSGSWLRPATAGVAVVLPVFFKQNMGLPFLMAVVVGAVLLLVFRLAGRMAIEENGTAIDARTLLVLLGSIAVSLLLALGLIEWTVGLGNYLHWTVRFSAERRLPGLSEMLAVYRQPSFLWTIPTLGAGLILLHSRLVERLWIRIAAVCLFAAPFVGCMAFLFVNDDLDERADNLLALWPLLLVACAALAIVELRKGISLGRLMPFFILAAIHGTFLSQQLWGSTYAIWPLLMVLMAQMLATLPDARRPLAPALAGVVCVTFLICGGLYAVGHERLNYVQLPDGPVNRGTVPALRGMAAPGAYVPEFEELLRFAEREIPRGDGLLLLPGEDPFYFASGRTPQFPVLLFDHTTDPYTPNELTEKVRVQGVRWVIVKRHLQLESDPLPQADEVYWRVAREFKVYRELTGYVVYRRRS